MRVDLSRRRPRIVAAPNEIKSHRSEISRKYGRLQLSRNLQDSPGYFCLGTGKLYYYFGLLKMPRLLILQKLVKRLYLAFITNYSHCEYH